MVIHFRRGKFFITHFWCTHFGDIYFCYKRYWDKFSATNTDYDHTVRMYPHIRVNIRLSPTMFNFPIRAYLARVCVESRADS